MNAFDFAVEKTLAHEGGYVNDPDDAGGETKYGISQRSHPEIDIETLTLIDAKNIYFLNYWNPNKYSDIENKFIAAKLFDMTVNMGARKSHINTQRALMSCGIRVKWDGLIGPITISAINSIEPTTLLAALRSEHAGFYRSLIAADPIKNKYSAGWYKRAYS